MLNRRHFLGGAAAAPGAVRAAAAAPPANWPDFRGPSGDGLAPGARPPIAWSESRGVRWKTPIHGRSWSTPAVWGRRIWLTTATEDGKRMFVLCVDRADGRVLLDRELFTNAEPEPLWLGQEGNTYASPSPVLNGDRVFVHFGSYGTACLDGRSLETRWARRDIRCTHAVGPGSSPVMHRSRLFLTFDGIDHQFVTALDTRSGKTLWTTPRTADFSFGDPADKTPQEQQKKAFSTPLLVENGDGGGGAVLVSCGAKSAYGYDPASGRELWRIAYRGFSNGSRPIAGHGFAYINTGYQRAELWAVRLGRQGVLGDADVAWKCSRNVPLNPSPILVDDLLYMLSGSGIFTCLDARTGDEVWKDRLPGTFTSSPLLAAGRLYCPGERGQTFVVQPGRTFKVLAENSLPDGCMASPVAVEEDLILRTRTHLYCLRG